MHRNIERYNKYSNKLVDDTGNRYQTWRQVRRFTSALLLLSRSCWYYSALAASSDTGYRIIDSVVPVYVSGCVEWLPVLWAAYGPSFPWAHNDSSHQMSPHAHRGTETPLCCQHILLFPMFVNDVFYDIWGSSVISGPQVLGTLRGYNGHLVQCIQPSQDGLPYPNSNRCLVDGRPLRGMMTLYRHI